MSGLVLVPSPMLLRPRRSNAFGPLWTIFDSSRFCGSNRPWGELEGRAQACGCTRVAREVASWKITCRQLARTRQICGLAHVGALVPVGPVTGATKDGPGSPQKQGLLVQRVGRLLGRPQTSWNEWNAQVLVPSALPGKRQVDPSLEEGARARLRSRLAALCVFQARRS